MLNGMNCVIEFKHLWTNLTIQPPLSLDDLSNFADQLIREYALDVEVRGWLMVEIHNQVWKETVASIPYERRVLLLPKCLSNSAKPGGN